MAVYDTAAPPVLDLNFFCRTMDSEAATSPTHVKPGDVMQFGLTLHNPRDWQSNAVARNVRVGFQFAPTAGGRIVVATAWWLSDNAQVQKDGPFRMEDTEVLIAEDSIRLNGLRNPQLQRNLVEPTNDPIFSWGDIEDIPEERVGPFEGGAFTIQPDESGEQKPCFSGALRIFFLANVEASQ